MKLRESKGQGDSLVYSCVPFSIGCIHPYIGKLSSALLVKCSSVLPMPSEGQGSYLTAAVAWFKNVPPAAGPLATVAPGMWKFNK